MEEIPGVRSLAQRAREAGHRHYPLFIALHAAWLSAILSTTPFDRSPDWALLGLFGVLQFGRLWVIRTLGRFWTTRIVTLDAMPLVRFGPYRLARHPNYWIVAAEIAVLPLAFGNWAVAVVFSVLNAALLRHRTRIEDAALARRA